MSRLQELKDAKNLTDLAKLLGFTPKGVSYVLYKLGNSKKYRTFEVPKKSGGTRTINAPEQSLALLQRRLAKLLTECVAELEKVNPVFWKASHGFRKSRTIVSNAEVHRRRRFVFNVDIKDFFGTINFGRVRGFFIHDKNFAVDPAVATVIAQIVCHDNQLPQGSPCSPIISNLLGNIIDARLLALARDNKCIYSRYADDLTFSTNEKLFPTEIAVNVQGEDWAVGKLLNKEIHRAGFELNPGKTRMSLRQSRQVVTGLVVNAKANINQDYYRAVRSMCHALFNSGSYYRHSDEDMEPIESTNPLEGMLSHIYFVKHRRDRNGKVNRAAIRAGEFHPPRAPVELYKKFLFYKHFVAPSAPLIVPEGVSDITYLKCAIEALAKSFPSLAEIRDGKTFRLINFLSPSATTRDVLNLGHGAAGQAALIERYASSLRKYPQKPMDHPVVILCDNDSGPASVFKAAKKKTGVIISKATTDPFYYLGENLYLVKVPEGTPPSDKDIEDLFDPALLKTVLDGKTFDKHKEHGDEKSYGKVIFAEKVVRANTSTVDFNGFTELLDRIEQCIAHYAGHKAAQNVAPATASTSP